MPGTAIVRLAPASSVTDLVEQARDFAQDARAEHTRRAYRSDWADFCTWCSSAAGAVPLPADPRVVALYLTAKAGELRVSTLARRLAAISAAHREAGELSPSSKDHPEGADLRRVWSGIRRRLGRPPRKKQALLTADLRRVVEAIPAGLTGARDRALLLLGFAGAMRREELASLALDEDADRRVDFVSEGLEISIDRSKGDQAGRGRVLAIPFGQTDLCPVAALEAWLKASQIRDGPIFRAVDRWGHLSAGAISPATVAARVKAACARVGMDPAKFAGHSLRSGLITQAAINGEQLHDIMGQSGHAKVETVRGYIQAAERMKRSVAGRVGL